MKRFLIPFLVLVLTAEFVMASHSGEPEKRFKGWIEPEMSVWYKNRIDDNHNTPWNQVVVLKEIAIAEHRLADAQERIAAALEEIAAALKKKPQ